jgi:hypothetical protein
MPQSPLESISENEKHRTEAVTNNVHSEQAKWGETESNWYAGHYLAYSTSAG